MNCGEWKKILQEWLETGELDLCLPEVAALRGVPQPAAFHAEGDALVHTLLAVESLADDEEEERVFWGTLLHDIGKSTTTRFVDGRWRAHGHDAAGAEMVPQALERVGRSELAEDVAWLVRNHLFHLSWNVQADRDLTCRQRRFTEHPLFPLLLKVCAADAAGSHGGSDKGQKAARIAEKAGHDTA